jgi:hypothetical protein
LEIDEDFQVMVTGEDNKLVRNAKLLCSISKGARIVTL